MENMLTQTLGQTLSELAVTLPHNIAVKYNDRDYSRTWKQFNEEVEEIAKGWLKLGIKKGDHIAIWATNIPEWLLTLFSAAKIGAILVTVNTNYKSFELEYLLRQSDTKALVLMDGFKDADYIKIIHEICPEISHSKDGNIDSQRFPFLKHIIYAGQNLPQGMLHFDALRQMGKEVSDEELRAAEKELDCHDVINMQYTSGTTGYPKGVMLTHYNILNNGKTIGDGMAFTSQDTLCITVPLFHCFGLVLAVMACITHGTTMVIVDYFSSEKVMKACSEEKCTALHGVPTMFIAILEHPNFKKYKFNLRTGIMAGSPCPIKVMRQVISDLGMKDIVIVYGQTEASPGCTMTTVNDSIELRVNTVGKAFPGVEIKVIDPQTGETLPPNTPGELCARGYNLMKGYYKMPEATAKAIDSEGWLHTGDLCTVDENGYYKIVGRIKDMIIRGGENIYPKEIEEFLYTHPKIKDVQVIGVPSKQYGEEVMACIILKDNQTMTEEEVKDFVQSHMARHKTPKYVRFMDSFPTTASGKIQKYKLREQAIEILKLQDAASIETA
ncbi:MAG: AMP-binding protein [Christensenellales bacterium]|jgi:fatty-acyl-CoA synthase|nr:AMP-binding protein [Clostridiales bacterium]